MSSYRILALLSLIEGHVDHVLRGMPSMKRQLLRANTCLWELELCFIESTKKIAPPGGP